MKPNLLVSSLAVVATAFLPNIAGAAPRAHLLARQHKSAAAKPARRPLPARRFGPKGRAYILNTARPGSDPNRGDHMAMGRGMHPERMDRMNTARPVPTTPAPKP